MVSAKKALHPSKVAEPQKTSECRRPQRYRFRPSFARVVVVLQNEEDDGEEVIFGGEEGGGGSVVSRLRSL